jgi:hypothetical protein
MFKVKWIFDFVGHITLAEEALLSSTFRKSESTIIFDKMEGLWKSEVRLKFFYEKVVYFCEVSPSGEPFFSPNKPPKRLPRGGTWLALLTSSSLAKLNVVTSSQLSEVWTAFLNWPPSSPPSPIFLLSSLPLPYLRPFSLLSFSSFLTPPRMPRQSLTSHRVLLPSDSNEKCQTTVLYRSICFYRLYITFSLFLFGIFFVESNPNTIILVQLWHLQSLLTSILYILPH